MSDSRVFDLPVSMANAWIFNGYVIEGDTSLIVVDPGLPVVADRLLEMVGRDLGRQPDDISGVVCTHAHPDHVAGVSTLTHATPCAVHLPQRCADYLAGEQPRVFPLVESTMRFLPVWGAQRFEPRAFAEFVRHGTSIGFGGPPMLTLDFEAAGFVDDGDPLPGAPGWMTIRTPGHTDDSTCWYHAESETLLSGDAVVTDDGRAWFNPEYVDAEIAGETEERLRSLPVRHLLPGHGRPIHAADVWSTARSFRTPPSGRGVLSRCARRFGRWLDT